MRLLVSCVLVVGATGAARADRAAADAAFDHAKRLVAAGKLAEACPQFELSYTEDPQLGALLNLADCHERIGKLATARSEFRSAAELAHRRRDDREPYARDRAAALDPRVAYVVIHRRPDAGAGAVRLDDHDVTAMLDSEMSLDPGRHVVAVGAWSGTIEVGSDGSHQQVTVPDAAPPASAAERPGALDARARAHVIAFAVGGAGVLAAGTGLYVGRRAFSDWDASRNGPCNAANVCDANGRDLVDSAKRAALASDVLVGVGAAAVLAAALLWGFAPAEHGVAVAPVVGPRAVGATLEVGF